MKNKKLYFAVTAALLSVICLGFSLYSFMTPARVKKKVTTQTLQQEVNFSHRVVPRKSALYQTPEPLSGRDIYLTRITDELKVGVRVDLMSEPRGKVAGTTRVILRLEAREKGDKELWDREYILAPEQQFEGEGNFTVLNDTFKIPLQRILSLIEQVEKETRVHPRDGYFLTVAPVVKAKATGQNLTNNFHPSFQLNLSQLKIEPEAKLSYQNTTFLRDTKVIPGRINLAGWKMRVITARYVFSIITLLGAALAAGLLLKYLKAKPPVSEAGAINRRYRARMVTASNSTLGTEMPVVRLDNFKELLRLADERDKSIIRIDEDTGQEKLCRYCVPDESTLYCYRASYELPGGGQVSRSGGGERFTPRNVVHS